jgi:NADPH-dependent ferric siderophore reductase
MVRITVRGEDLAAFVTRGPAEHLRVLLPAAGEDEPALPEWGPAGPVYPEGRARPSSRAYTPRRWNAAARELDIEFFLHGEGPASAWAAGVQPGDRLAVTDGRGAWQPDAGCAWHLIAGDEAALPAIATVLETLPAGARAHVLAEIGDPADEQAFVTRADARITWVNRERAGKAGSIPGSALEAAMKAMPWPEGRGCAFIACEAVAMRNLRRHLLNDRGMERGSLHTQGYWKYGAANHPDHDRGEDV